MPRKPAKVKLGGKRPGAGRKKHTATYLREKAEAQANSLINAELPQLIANLIRLANGGYERIEERYEPAGLHTYDEWEIDKDTGKRKKVRKPLFPDVDPSTPVLIYRHRSIADGDRAANIYLLDRILGKPHEQVKQVGDSTQNTQINVNVMNEAQRRVADKREEWTEQIRELLTSEPQNSLPAPSTPVTSQTLTAG